MNVEEFRSKIRVGKKLIVGEKEFVVKEVVRFRFDDGSYYIKCFLSDDYVFADDLNENIFILVKEKKTSFVAPFPERLNFQDKNFEFLYAAHAIAEETWGEEIFKKGGSEQFWDYKADNGEYLSLGINEQSKQRVDSYGTIILNSSVIVKE